MDGMIIWAVLLIVGLLGIAYILKGDLLKTRKRTPDQRAEEHKRYTVISGFAGTSQYVWDGEYLSVYAGQRLLRMDGRYISDLGGTKKFTWKNDCLSSVAGKKLFTVSSGIVSVVGQGPLYRYDKKYIYEFGGQKLLSLKGDIALPEAIVGVLVIMIRNFIDVD